MNEQDSVNPGVANISVTESKNVNVYTILCKHVVEEDQSRPGDMEGHQSLSIYKWHHGEGEKVWE